MLSIVYLVTALLLFVNNKIYTKHGVCLIIFVSGRELAFTFATCRRNSVCRLSVVCRLSATLVQPTQPVEIFGNFFHRTIAQGL